MASLGQKVKTYSEKIKKENATYDNIQKEAPSYQYAHNRVAESPEKINIIDWKNIDIALEKLINIRVI